MAEGEGFEPSPHFREADLANQCDATYFTDLPSRMAEIDGIEPFTR